MATEICKISEFNSIGNPIFPSLPHVPMKSGFYNLVNSIKKGQPCKHMSKDGLQSMRFKFPKTIRLTDKDKGGKNHKIMYSDFHHLMEQAIREAEKALAMGEVPVGAVLSGPEGDIVAKAHNEPITLHDPTAHAEILALRKGAVSYKNYRIKETTLVVTIEPCLMCMGAALNARVSRLVFGAFDPKSGAAGSLYNLAADNRLNHRIKVISGVMENECRRLLQEFFLLRRGRPNRSWRGTEVVVTGSTRNRLVPLEAGHVGSNPTLSANNFNKLR